MNAMARSAVIATVLVIVAIIIIVGSETPCPSFPQCAFTTAGLWAGVAFVLLALVVGLLGALGGRGRVGQPPNPD